MKPQQKLMFVYDGDDSNRIESAIEQGWRVVSISAAKDKFLILLEK